MIQFPFLCRPTKHADITITHKEPVTCVRFNPSFKQVITCSESSVSLREIINIPHFLSEKYLGLVRSSPFSLFPLPFQM